jgi:CRP/FNR family transcriptional regulator/CRP/FNR family cyclic AMP-dependent transcriptional regulator
MPDTDILDRVPIFAGLEAREHEALSKGMRRRTYKRGEVLFHRDDQGSLLYCILSGHVRIYLPTGTGEEVTLDVLKPGEIFGELAVFDDLPRSASAMAVEDVVVVTLDRTHVLSSLSEYPRAAGRILAELSGRLRQTNQMLEDIITLDVPGRICKKLLELARDHGTPTPHGVVIGIRFTQQELASMIGATRESTNKVLRNFQARGLIKVDGQTLTLVRPEVLRQRIEYAVLGGDR